MHSDEFDRDQNGTQGSVPIRSFNPEAVAILSPQAPRSATAAQLLSVAQDAISRVCLLEPLAEVLPIIRPITAYYDA